VYGWFKEGTSVSVELRVNDESPGSDPVPSLTLSFLNERITVRELIRERVYQEVRERNADTSVRYASLVERRAASGWETHEKPSLTDWEAQYQVALEGFERNRYFVLVDDRQLTSLDEKFSITPATSVRFIKLVQLVGG
jgi:hypothetical protein